MAQENGDKWDKNLILTLIGIIISFILGGLALLFTVATPELRDFFGLNDQNIPATPAPSVPAPKPKPEQIQSRIETSPNTPVPKIQQHVEKPKPSGPFSATLHENQTQLIEEAKTRLSINFNEELKIVTLIIAPDGEQSSNRAVLNGYTEEFTSSTGVFLVHILNENWDSRAVTVQVSKKI